MSLIRGFTRNIKKTDILLTTSYCSLQVLPQLLNRDVALWLKDIITPKNKSRRLPVAIISLVVGPKDPIDTSGSFGMPSGFKMAPGFPPDYHVLFI